MQRNIVRERAARRLACIGSCRAKTFKDLRFTGMIRTRMKRFGLWLFAVATMAAVAFSPLCLWAQSKESGQITGVRVAHNNNVTRFVLDVSKEITFKISVSNSEVTIDLPGLDWKANVSGLTKPVGLIQNYQFSKINASLARLTLKTAGPVRIEKSFLLPPIEAPHYRLVIDLGPANGPTSSVPIKTPIAKPVVVIDPGHGGVDPGAISKGGSYEKDIVLSLAKTLKETLEKSGKARVILTRSTDVFIPLRERVAVARAANADLFISLHADSIANKDIKGLSVYTLSQTASDAEAQALADKENKSDIVAGLDFSNEPPEVTNILIDLVQRETMNYSARFASRVIGEAQKETSNVLKINTHRFAGFAVLKAPDVPSVLVEIGYLSNAKDEKMLLSKEYRAKLAKALTRAIEGYFADEHPKR